MGDATDTEIIRRVLITIVEKKNVDVVCIREMNRSVLIPCVDDFGDK